MRLSASSRDTILAVLDLAVYSGSDNKAVKLQDIAERQSIALSWLEQLFAKLRKQDIVKSIRGPGGGYILARTPEQIHVASVISCASGAIDMRQCQGRENCRSEQRCLAHDLWDYINDQLNTALSHISIKDIIDKLNLSRLNEEKFMSSPIYFDYAATTPVDSKVAERMMHYLTQDGVYGNAASRSHYFGWQAEEAIENARNQVAEFIHADPREIVWTSGATESNNLAIKGAARFYQDKGKHILTSRIEHKAVLDTCRQLEKEGFDVTYLEPDNQGVFSLEKITSAIREDTILLSFMHVNNEIGIINDIAAIGKLAREKGIIFHVDAAQSAGKIPIDLQAMPIDLMSFSAHKVYGPKGIGALYVSRKPRIRLEAQIHGGGHERGMRSGTLPTHQIVGMGEAFAIAEHAIAIETKRIAGLRDMLWDGIKDMEAVYINGNLAHQVPGILNISFNYVEGESLLMSLKNIAVSSGSACTSASLEPSYVLRALGLSDELAHSSIRFSIGRFTKEEEIKELIARVRHAVTKLRELSPLWEMYKDGVDLNKVAWAAH